VKYLFRSKHDLFLIVLGALCFLVVLLTAESSPLLSYFCNSADNICPSSENSKFWNTLFFTLSSGTLLSIFLFFLLSRYPQSVKERAARRTLLRQYRRFKLNCIDIFVVISGANQSVEYEDLLSINKFRDFFKSNKSPHQTNWDGVANNLTPYYLNLLSKHIEGLRNDIENILGGYEVLNDADREKLERLSHHLRLIQTNENDYDSIKSFCGSMWSIFTSWDWVEGYPDDDKIESLLTSI